MKISLNKEAIKALKQLRLKRNSSIGERAHYVLLAGQGYSSPQIAVKVNRNAHTVRKWIRQYCEAGIAGLATKPPPGRPAKKAPIIESQIEELLSRPPSAYGYQSAGWQVNLLRDYFSKQGCQVCETTLVKALKKVGYVYKRFSKSIPKNTPTAEEKNAAMTEIISKIQWNKKDGREIIFADESHFSNQPYVNRGWFKKGEKKQSIRRKTV